MEGGKISYYENPSDSAPYGVNEKGFIFLKGTTIESHSDNAKIAKNSIFLTATSGNKDLLLEAPDEATFNSWNAEIRRHAAFYTE